MKIKFVLIALVASLLLSSCSSSSLNGGEPFREPTDEEIYTDTSKPDCVDILDSKKIDRNPEAFIGQCGVLYLKVIDAFKPDDCKVRVNYDSAPFEYGDYESYMGFFDCEDALDFYTGDYYKVTAHVNGSFTFETVLGASRTLADLTIIDVLE
jgi:hypothetical protein